VFVRSASDFVHAFSNTVQGAICSFPFPQSTSAKIDHLIAEIDELASVGEPAQSTCVAMLHKAGKRMCSSGAMTDSWLELWTESLCVRDFASVSHLLRRLWPAIEGQHPIVIAARQHIAGHYAEPNLNAAVTARALGVTRRRLAAALSKGGVPSYRHLLRWTRVTHAVVLLRTPGLLIKEAAFACGFRHASEFSRACVDVMGTSPLKLVRRAEARAPRPRQGARRRT
jgi:AraC-like DNA-binding protein